MKVLVVLGLAILVGSVFVVGAPPAPRDAVAVAAAPVLRPGDMPIGSLGHPLGAYLIVEGIAAERGPQGEVRMTIHVVNGKRLEKPTLMVLDKATPAAGQRVAFKGYESVRMTGAAPAVIAEKLERGIEAEHLPWAMQLHFVALKAVEPAPAAAS